MPNNPAPPASPQPIPNPVTEAVARAIKRSKLERLGYSERETERMMSNHVPMSGELADANAAILAHLLAIRVPMPGMLEGTHGATIDTVVWQRAIDQLIANAREAGNG